jgi:hypothetical protein
LSASRNLSRRIPHRLTTSITCRVGLSERNSDGAKRNPGFPHSAALYPGYTLDAGTSASFAFEMVAAHHLGIEKIFQDPTAKEYGRR